MAVIVRFCRIVACVRARIKFSLNNLLQTFTYEGKLYAAPKDVSTLQLVINTDMWQAAGLIDNDYPKTWDELGR